MFSYHDFIATTLKRMVRGGEPDYRVMQYAAAYYDKSVLTDADLEEVQSLVAERDSAETEETEDTQ